MLINICTTLTYFVYSHFAHATSVNVSSMRYLNAHCMLATPFDSGNCSFISITDVVLFHVYIKPLYMYYTRKSLTNCELWKAIVIGREKKWFYFVAHEFMEEKQTDLRQPYCSLPNNILATCGMHLGSCSTAYEKKKALALCSVYQFSYTVEHVSKPYC